MIQHLVRRIYILPFIIDIILDPPKLLKIWFRTHNFRIQIFFFCFVLIYIFHHSFIYRILLWHYDLCCFKSSINILSFYLHESDHVCWCKGRSIPQQSYRVLPSVVGVCCGIIFGWTPHCSAFHRILDIE